ncbi:hypothetical protein [Bradyrhizobium elkanii]|uniref:hypothetical protein n=1 Tax=Bradyrhizobium elkanii TaxID=29448 RepID=UPI0012BD23DF|nr:hypothetical protein [Bradyrhizobium elkanii]
MAKLQSEIRGIEVRISELEAEKHALMRILERTKSEIFSGISATRKNSYSKIVVEQEILQALRHRGGPVSSADLLAQARTVKYNLKPVTFRTHLHRLKAKGLIVNSDEKGRGHWSLVPKKD